MKAKICMYMNDGKAENGFPVKIILSHNRKVRRRTISHALENEWDQNFQIPTPKHPDYNYLYDIASRIRNECLRSEFKNLEDFNEAFDYILQNEKPVIRDFYKYAQQRIDFMFAQKRDGNAKQYEYAVSAFKIVAPTLTFEEITPELIEELKEYKRGEGTKDITIKKYIAEIEAIYNHAVRKKITEDKKPFANAYKDLRIKRGRSEKGFLDREMISLLQRIDDLTPGYQRAVHLSLLQFYLGGANLSDIYHIEKDWIHNNRLYFPTRKKLRDRGSEFNVFIFPIAWEIINKYKTEGKYLFPWPKGHTQYETFRNNHNRDLKIVQERYNIKVSPRGGNLTSNVMRRTFATWGKYERFEEDIIRELMGHERKEIDTVYKELYPEADRNKAQYKIITGSDLNL